MYVFYVYGYLACMYGYAPLAYVVPEEAGMVRNFHVGAGNQTWVFGKATSAFNHGVISLASLNSTVLFVCF